MTIGPRDDRMSANTPIAESKRLVIAECTSAAIDCAVCEWAAPNLVAAHRMQVDCDLGRGPGRS
jgi:hypothetical protein